MEELSFPQGGQKELVGQAVQLSDEQSLGIATEAEDQSTGLFLLAFQLWCHIGGLPSDADDSLQFVPTVAILFQKLTVERELTTGVLCFGSRRDTSDLPGRSNELSVVLLENVIHNLLLFSWLVVEASNHVASMTRCLVQSRQ